MSLSFQDQTLIYYQRLYPTELIYKWLKTNSSPSDCSKREFSFTSHNEIYIRYLSYVSWTDMEKDILLKNPQKIDIGAVCNYQPSMYKSVIDFKFLFKELVIDIDISDYDDARFCCSGTDICSKCWPLINIAIEIIHTALTNDFGFKHVIWFFSGRRGVHCWIMDKKVFSLSNYARHAIMDYLSIIIKSNETSKKLIVNERDHHHIRRSVKTLEPFFENYAIEQDLFSTNERLSKICQLIPQEKTFNDVMRHLEPARDTKDRLYGLKNFLKELNLYHYYEDIIMYICYPRLDVNVSKTVNHLLKSPFCIHPKTGLVCIPIINHQKFNPEEVPTIQNLLVEIDNISKANFNSKKLEFWPSDAYHTSLSKYISFFKEHINSLENSRLKDNEHKEVSNFSTSCTSELF